MTTESNTIESVDRGLEPLTAIFRLLSDQTRLNILMLLVAGEMNVTSLCEKLQLPQPTVSHHLGLLRTSKVIGNRRMGKQVFYRLNGNVDANHSAVTIEVQGYDVRISKTGVTASV